MSLLMQALRKAERAKHGEVLTGTHDGDLQANGLQLEAIPPLETDVQKAAAGSEATAAGGASFTLEPLEPPASAAADRADDEEIPVIPAEEAMHDPVPPQARPGAQRGAAAWLRPVDSAGAADVHSAADTRAALQARAAADARRAADMPHGPGASAGGLSAEPPAHAAPPAASTTPSSTPRGPSITSAFPAASAGSAGAGASQAAGTAPPNTTSVDDAYFADRPPLRKGVATPTVRAPGSASDHLGRPRAGHGHSTQDASAPWNRSGAAARASASASRYRTLALAGVLSVVVLGFGYLYWRGISSPGPGAALPPVPMPGSGAIATAPAVAPGALPGAMVPGVDAHQQQAGMVPGTQPATADASQMQPGGVNPGVAAGAAGAGATITAGSAPGTSNGALPAAGSAAPSGALSSAPPAPGLPGAASAASVAASGSRSPIVIPTPEALAAIEDPAIRAEAMRDASERAARAARDAEASHRGTHGGESGVMVASTTPAGAHISGPGNASSPSGAVRSTRNAHAAGAGGVAGTGGSQNAGRAGTGSTSAVNISGGTPAATDTADVHIVRNNATPQVSPTLQNAWSAYQSGDLAAAHQQYDAALLQDPNNRDALLGAAAVAGKERNGQQAAAHYLRLLELDPHDPEALAGLVALRPGDLPQAETKLKGILRTTPESGPVLFTLGNLYAKQGRWSEAQQAYFRAYGAAPANADYAFNLAVGLDRLNQSRLAQDYYQRALSLAQSAPAAFDQNAVRKRLAELAAAAP